MSAGVRGVWKEEYRRLYNEKKQCFKRKNGRMVLIMKIDKIEEYLSEISYETDFYFTVVEDENKEILLYMQGDNPEGEDWCTEFTIKNPKNKRELLETLYEEVLKYYEAFDIEEEVYLMLEAKRNGFQGVPGIVDLVHNEEYKEKALESFIIKLKWFL